MARNRSSHDVALQHRMVKVHSPVDARSVYFVDQVAEPPEIVNSIRYGGLNQLCLCGRKCEWQQQQIRLRNRERQDTLDGQG